MFKRFIQQCIPDVILQKYKQHKFFRLVRDFDINDEPDLLIARNLIDKNSVFVDIGANIGLYTRFLSPHAKSVISFEPVPFTFSILSKNISKFGLQNVELHPVAISDDDGHAIIEVPIQAGVRNYFRAALSEQKDNSESEMAFTVKTASIDSLFSGSNDDITFIKCDAEGHELAIIKGAGKFLQENRPSWLIEVSGNPDESGTEAAELFSIMKKYNYEIFFYDGQTLRKFKPGDKSINYFFLQDGHLDLILKNDIEINMEG